MNKANPGLSLELVWDLIESTVSKAELRTALGAIDEPVPQTDAEFDPQRLAEPAGRFATVRSFPPAMIRGIDFDATGDANAGGGAEVDAAPPATQTSARTRTPSPTSSPHRVGAAGCPRAGRIPAASIPTCSGGVDEEGNPPGWTDLPTAATIPQVRPAGAGPRGDGGVSRVRRSLHSCCRHERPRRAENGALPG